jgi:hypothetical protein
VRGVTNELDQVDIFVRAFANLSGLGAALERDGRLKNASQVREFAAGFSSRHAFFDFVDVGPGKERADFKVRGEKRQFLYILAIPMTFTISIRSPFLIINLWY